MQLFPEKAAWFKIQEAPVASSSESGGEERENVSSASHSLLGESSATSSLSPSFQFATSANKPCRVVTRRRPVLHAVPCCAVLCSASACSPVVNHLHVAVLLDPELAHNDVVNAACGICPCVGFVVAADIS